MVMTVRSPSNYSTLAVRYANENPQEGLASVRSAWREFGAVRPFDYTFLSESIDNQYEAEQRTSALFSFFALLALIVTSLGLLGVTIFVVQRRTKEIGVRKAMGATTPQIAVLLSTDLLKLLGIAAVLASPIAYLGVAQWLENFAYQAQISLLNFILAFTLIVITALLTTAYHVRRAANTDPAKVLQIEDV